MRVVGRVAPVVVVGRVPLEQAGAVPEKDKLIGKQNCLPLLLAGDAIGSAAQLSDTRVTLPLMGNGTGDGISLAHIGPTSPEYWQCARE